MKTFSLFTDFELAELHQLNSRKGVISKARTDKQRKILPLQRLGLAKVEPCTKRGLVENPRELHQCRQRQIYAEEIGWIRLGFK